MNHNNNNLTTTNPYESLHTACQNNAPPTTIQSWLETKPQDAQETDFYGRTPLHETCKHSSHNDTTSTLRLLIQAYPDALRKKDMHGKTPLRIALEHGASAHIIELLIDSEDDDDLDWKRKRRGSSTDTLQKKDPLGRTPLHLACVSNANLDVIDLLLTRYPTAIEMKTDAGRTPLYEACESGVSVDVLRRLLRDGNAKVLLDGRENQQGWTPLHTATANGAGVDVVSFLVGEWPAAVWKRDRDLKQTPLHVACSKRACAEVVEALLLVDNGRALGSERDRFENVPLHSAVKCKAPLESVKVLIGYCPGGLEEVNENGDTPLSMAECCGATDEVVSLLRSLHVIRQDDSTYVDVLRVLQTFVEEESFWWAGIVLVLKSRPGLLQGLDFQECLIPQLLSRAAREGGGDPQLLFNVLKGLPNLFDESSGRDEG